MESSNGIISKPRSESCSRIRSSRRMPSGSDTTVSGDTCGTNSLRIRSRQSLIVVRARPAMDTHKHYWSHFRLDAFFLGMLFLPVLFVAFKLMNPMLPHGLQSDTFRYALACSESICGLGLLFVQVAPVQLEEFLVCRFTGFLGILRCLH